MASRHYDPLYRNEYGQYGAELNNEGHRDETVISGLIRIFFQRPAFHSFEEVKQNALSFLCLAFFAFLFAFMIKFLSFLLINFAFLVVLCSGVSFLVRAFPFYFSNIVQFGEGSVDSLL